MGLRRSAPPPAPARHAADRCGRLGPRGLPVRRDAARRRRVGVELAARHRASRACRAAVALALATALLLVWGNAAVGLVGNEGDPANLAFGLVLATGIAGAIATRLRAAGMAVALTATGLVQVALGVVAALAAWGRPETTPVEIVGLTGLFAGLWFASAWLFRAAARAEG